METQTAVLDVMTDLKQQRNTPDNITYNTITRQV